MSLSTHRSHDRADTPSDPARRDLVRAWIAVAVMIVMLAAMPLIGSLGIEGSSFWLQYLALAAFLVVLLVLAAGAIRFGLDARRAGKESGILPAAIGGAIGGLFALLVVAVLLARLVGFE